MMHHVIHLRDSNFLGGPEKQILRYIEASVPDYRNTLALFSSDENEFAREARRRGAEILCLPESAVDAFRALRDFVRSESPLLICCHGYKADVLGISAAKGTLSKTAAFQRGNTGESVKVALYETIQRACLPFANYVVALSATQAGKMQQNPTLRGRVRTVINSVAPSDVRIPKEQARVALRERFSLAADCRVVVWSGRLSREKGAADFVRAAALTNTEDVEFILFGHGPERHRVQSLIEASGRNNITLAGFHPDFSALLQGADLLVNTSYREQMPNVVLESMSCGVPVIATEVGAVAELAGAERGICLVRAGDITGTAAQMISLLDDVNEQRRLAETARMRIDSHFSLPLQARQLRELFCEAAGE